jgi:hypothetical protein
MAPRVLAGPNNDGKSRPAQRRNGDRSAYFSASVFRIASLVRASAALD